MVEIGSANDFETVSSIKMVTMSKGSFEEAVILQETDFNRIANKASETSSFYKSPNS